MISIPMLLWCPECGKRHIDEGEFAEKKHHTHACQYCGHVWRPCLEPTCGVKFLPGYKTESENNITYERELFERYASLIGLNLKRSNPIERYNEFYYDNENTTYCWLGWLTSKEISFLSKK